MGDLNSPENLPTSDSPSTGRQEILRVTIQYNRLRACARSGIVQSRVAYMKSKMRVGYGDEE